MKRFYVYNGQYGLFVFDFLLKEIVVDKLSREAIWRDSDRKYMHYIDTFSSIIADLFGDDLEKIFPPQDKDEVWNGKSIDYGFQAIGKDFVLTVAFDGSRVERK